MKQNVAVSIGQQLAARADATVNHEGGLAFTMQPLTRLYTRLCASLMGEQKFYADGATSDAKLVADIKAAAAVHPEGTLILMAFARQTMNIRSTPVYGLAVAAEIPACKPFVRRWTPEIVRRADEPGEVIASWVKRHGPIGSHGKKGGEHAFPNSLSRGLEDALDRFSEYHIAKYDRDGAVKMRDVISILRPKAKTPERNALYRFMRRGEVNAELLPKLAAKASLLQKKELDAEALELMARANVTWEVATSHFGRKPEVWNALTLPFMAGLRNVRNLLQLGAAEALEQVIGMLRDPDHVRRSRQLPFRFYSAYRVVESLHDVDATMRSRVTEAILEALTSSVANLPRLGGTTFITNDNSGSMSCGTISERSTVRRVDVCNLLGSIAHSMCDRSIVSVFGDEHAVVPLMRQDSILTNMAKLAGTDVGHSTNAYLAIRHLRETKTRVDRIILLSDMQCYDNGGDGEYSLAEELRKYKSSVNPDVYLYSVDLAGYGTAQFPKDERHVAMLAGWSERMFEFIPLFEEDGTQAVERILAWRPRSTQPVPATESASAVQPDDAGEADDASAGDE